MGTTAPSAHVAGRIEGANLALCSSALGVASEKSVKAWPALSSGWLWAHFLLSQVHMLVLSCPSGVTHSSTNTILISQVTEMP